MKAKLDKYLKITLFLCKQQNIIERKLSRVLEELNLTLQQFFFLYILDELEKENITPTSNDLIEKMGIQRSAVSRLGGRIEELQLVNRELKGTKTVIFKLTDLGKSILLEGMDLITTENLENMKMNSLNSIYSNLEDIKKIY